MVTYNFYKFYRVAIFDIFQYNFYIVLGVLLTSIAKCDSDRGEKTFVRAVW